jgi:hypothetical protein
MLGPAGELSTAALCLVDTPGCAERRKTAIRLHPLLGAAQRSAGRPPNSRCDRTRTGTRRAVLVTGTEGPVAAKFRQTR